MGQLIDIIQGDITTLDVDAIVNAANRSLNGGGGVDGAIHRAAGPKLHEACRPLGGCAVGQVKVTPGFKLPARYILHTPGPIWRGGKFGEDNMLARCYRNCLKLAGEKKLTSIAFPAISTGAYGFPLLRATRLALETVSNHLSKWPTIEQVIFVCFSKDDFDVYWRCWEELKASRQDDVEDSFSESAPISLA